MSELTSFEYIKLLKQLTWRRRHIGRRLESQLKVARAFGDFSENTELQIAKAGTKTNAVKLKASGDPLERPKLLTQRRRRGELVLTHWSSYGGRTDNLACWLCLVIWP
ncbi:MAG: hypothetical protein ACTS68_02030 [Candidatus Hodgkinia cicadicola]